MTRWPPPGSGASLRARSLTVGWSFFLRAESPGPRSVAPGRSLAAPGRGRAGREIEPPPEAGSVFGSALGAAERYAELLAGPGVEQGLIGPRETARLWDRHLMNCAAIAELVPDPCSVIDLGSGSGLSGFVLAMLLPDSEFVLLEPMARRVLSLEDWVSLGGVIKASVHRVCAEE